MEEIVQDFDWEAAVAEIDKACDKNQQSKATNKHCQKTLDAFLKLSQPTHLCKRISILMVEKVGKEMKMLLTGTLVLSQHGFIQVSAM
jgi:hypothetical protein